MVIGQAGTTGFFIWLNQSVGLRWRSTNSDSNRQADFSLTNDTRFHQYAIVAAGTTITLYRDGALFGTATGKSTGFTVDAIGQAYNNNSYSFNGQIDEVWIFDQALTVGQVHNLYAVNSINAIPVPAALSAGLALMPLVAVRRRRR